MGYQNYWDRRDSSNSASWRNPNTPQGQANIQYENRLYNTQARTEGRPSSHTGYSGSYTGTGNQAVEESAPESGGFWAFVGKVGQVTKTVVKVGTVVVGGAMVLGAAGAMMQSMSSEPEAQNDGQET